jgi:hypothetical protein
MGKRRGRRTHSDESTPSSHRLDSWELLHSPFTVEGRIEQAARFSRGLRRARGRKRLVGYVMFWLFFSPIVLGVLFTVVHFVTRG